MTGPGLLAVASAVAAVVAGRHRPRVPRRMTALARWSRAPGRRPSARPRHRPGVAARLGRSLRGLANRPPDPAADRRVGRAVLAAVVLMPVHPVLALGAAVGLFSWPVLQERRAQRDRDRTVRDELPDVVELFRLAVGAGLTVPLAVDAVARRVDGCFGAALGEVRVRVEHGERLSDALAALADVGEAARPLAAALIASEREGAPLAHSLERVAADARLVRRRRAEEDARRLPVQLLFPLVACVLPAFGLLTVVPLLAGSLPSLGP